MVRFGPEALLRRLLAAYGPQRWWPARIRFEVLMGAVLTQNTAWRNVEQAIARLREADCLEAETLLGCDDARLAELLRPAGTYRVKSRRLRALCQWFRAEGGFPELDKRPTDRLRGQLLAVHGVGRETADAILLYGFGRPVFVVDAYTVRLFARLGFMQPEAGYEKIRAWLESRVEPGQEGQRYNELHALIVEHCKRVCRPRPRCNDCCLGDVCEYPRRAARSA